MRMRSLSSNVMRPLNPLPFAHPDRRCSGDPLDPLLLYIHGSNPRSKLEASSKMWSPLTATLAGKMAAAHAKAEAEAKEKAQQKAAVVAAAAKEKSSTKAKPAAANGASQGAKRAAPTRPPVGAGAKPNAAAG
eukprot:4495953-Prymnesium_polylepis.1